MNNVQFVSKTFAQSQMKLKSVKCLVDTDSANLVYYHGLKLNTNALSAEKK